MTKGDSKFRLPAQVLRRWGDRTRKESAGQRFVWHWELLRVGRVARVLFDTRPQVSSRRRKSVEAGGVDES